MSSQGEEKFEKHLGREDPKITKKRIHTIVDALDGEDIRSIWPTGDDHFRTVRNRLRIKLIEKWEKLANQQQPQQPQPAEQVVPPPPKRKLHEVVPQQSGNSSAVANPQVNFGLDHDEPMGLAEEPVQQAGEPVVQPSPKSPVPSPVAMDADSMQENQDLPTMDEEMARNLATTLLEHGAVTIPLPRYFVDESGNRITFKKMLKTVLRRMPEYAEQAHERCLYVLGGFGALGNPSAFHDREIQRYRFQVKNFSRPLFRQYAIMKYGARAEEVGLELLADRVCIRHTGVGEVGSENWHCDVTSHKRSKHMPNDIHAESNQLTGTSHDVIFGGWHSIQQNQSAAVLRGTHYGEKAKDAIEKGDGFDKFTPDEIRSGKFKEKLLQQSDLKDSIYGLEFDSRGHIVIPEGHLFVFHQQMAHKVASSSKNYTHTDPLMRIFVGFRLTNEDEPLMGMQGLCARIEAGKRFTIPSGQEAAIYSTNHNPLFANDEEWRNKLDVFDGRVKEIFHSSKGVSFPRPDRYMKSLKAYGLWDERFKYTDETMRALLPEKL